MFKELYSTPPFIDRYQKHMDYSIDVVIPLKTVNELFEMNLLSIYREIPVHRLIIGNGGCSKEVLEILKRFPRVLVVDQTGFKTLGFCIKQLINTVETELFVYLHADAFLPSGWFDVVYPHSYEFDWFEVREHTVVIVEYIDRYEDTTVRAFSGAQMGRTLWVKDAVKVIKDDYLYRNEDIVIRELVEQHGGRYGKVKDMFYVHEQIHPLSSNVYGVSIKKNVDRNVEVQMLMQQIQGILKYTKLKPYLLKILLACCIDLIKAKMKSKG